MSYNDYDFVQGLKEQSITHFDWAKSLIQGCSQDEINQILKTQEVRYLPALYIEFMLLMGKMSIVFETNLYYAYPHVLRFKTRTQSFLTFWNETSVTLPKDAFVFYEAEQSAFYYFLTEQQINNPMIFYIWEDDGVFQTERIDTLSNFLQKNLNAQISIYKAREIHNPDSIPPNR